MIPLHIEEKLQMFQCEKYVVLREKEQKELVEKSRSGKVKLTFTALGDTLILLSPECNVLPYLDEKQKGRPPARIFLYTGGGTREHGICMSLSLRKPSIQHLLESQDGSL